MRIGAVELRNIKILFTAREKRLSATSSFPFRDMRKKDTMLLLPRLTSSIITIPQVYILSLKKIAGNSEIQADRV